MNFKYRRNFFHFLAGLAGEILREPYIGDIIDWIRNNINLPSGRGYAISGPIDLDLSPWLIAPLRSLQNSSVKKVVCYKAVQTGGTLIADLWIPWIILKDPGPIQISTATDELAMHYLRSRLYPLLRSNRWLESFLPESDRELTLLGFRLQDSMVYVSGCKPSAYQSKSVRYVIGDEVHLWPDGSLHQALSRLSFYDRLGNSKALIISQPGHLDDDMDQIFKSGIIFEWAVPCPLCMELIVPEFMRFDPQSRQYYGLQAMINLEQFDPKTRKYDLNQILPGIAYRCSHCHEFFSQPEDLKAWNLTGRYLVRETKNANPAIHAYRWNAISMTRWEELIKEYVLALEMKENSISTDPMVGFYTKRIAIPETPEMREYLEEIRIYTEQYDISGEWKDAVARIATVDCQKDHYWLCIRDWAKNGASRQIFFGKIESDRSLVDTIKSFKVDHRWVFVDIAWSDLQESGIRKVYELVKQNEYTGLRGVYMQDRVGFLHKKDDIRIYSPAKRIEGSNRWYYQFDSTVAKNIVADLRDREIRDKSGYFRCLKNSDYEMQMYGERIQTVRNKNGKYVKKWVEIPGKQNHAFDCESMQVVAASLHPEIKLFDQFFGKK